MSLISKLKKPVPKQPLWTGPNGEGKNGGVTQSLLAKFLTCRERFRILVVEGLRGSEKFSKVLEYGNFFHLCCEKVSKGEDWQGALKGYATSLCKRYPFSQQEVEHWYNVCLVQFPLYLDYWDKHPARENVTPLLAEQPFDVPYRLPSGREVRLRGKWDGVDLVEKREQKGVYLFESKTKGEINEEEVVERLGYDLQTMMYTIALEAWINEHCQNDPGMAEQFSCPIKGVRYNVIRRPLSGGKGNISRHKGKPAKRLKSGTMSAGKPEETWTHFYGRLKDVIAADAASYFMRWTVDVTAADIQRFRKETLDPVLEQLCDWYEWISLCHQRGGDPFRNPVHWRHPYGCTNSIDEGYSTDVERYLIDGSKAGLTKVDTLFRELEEN